MTARPGRQRPGRTWPGGRDVDHPDAVGATFIDAHHDRFGIQPICQVLQVAPSTFHAGENRPPSARQRRDEQLKAEISRLWHDNFEVYGSRKMWRRSTGRVCGWRCMVARLMRVRGGVFIT
ncbi:hypothetical protein HII36_03500 [Nonomuraea sp. NN258]|uniref:hypothetical protein n=1 Tax=Nonomuraea antri TaxID=2730852 RepID=UPI00156A72A4|nr:hypothetical protein [Nonomuraea antri]NRQ30904.1 hypothetical protein [Nonomuraea antri]